MGPLDSNYRGVMPEAIMVAFGWINKSVALEERLLIDRPIASIHNNPDLPNPNPRRQPKTPPSR